MKGVDSTKQEQSQPRFDLGELSLDPLFSTVLLFMPERHARPWTCAKTSMIWFVERKPERCQF